MEYFSGGAFSNSANTSSSSKKTENDDKIGEVSYKSKAKMYEDYLLLTDENFDNLNIEKHATIDFCNICGIEKTLYMSEGKMICNKCGDESFILIDSDKPSYKEPPREISYFAYKRIIHFNEWWHNFRQGSLIFQEVYNQIISELKKKE